MLARGAVGEGMSRLPQDRFDRVQDGVSQRVPWLLGAASLGRQMLVPQLARSFAHQSRDDAQPQAHHFGLADLDRERFEVGEVRSDQIDSG